MLQKTLLVAANVHIRKYKSHQDLSFSGFFFLFSFPISYQHIGHLCQFFQIEFHAASSCRPLSLLV